MQADFLSLSVPRNNFLRRRDARAKLIALVAVLVALSVSRANIWALGLLLSLFLLCAVAARLPLLQLLKRTALVLPFCAAFAIFAVISGDTKGAGLLIVRAYAAGFAAVLFAAATSIFELLRALEQFHAPQFLLTVTQLLYRYAFVLLDDAQQTRAASLSRGGFKGKSGFRAAAGALATLFARSHSRAAQINHAMIARGYTGSLPLLYSYPFTLADSVLAASSIVLLVAITLWMRY